MQLLTTGISGLLSEFLAPRQKKLSHPGVRKSSEETLSGKSCTRKERMRRLNPIAVDAANEANTGDTGDAADAANAADTAGEADAMTLSIFRWQYRPNLQKPKAVFPADAQIVLHCCCCCCCCCCCIAVAVAVVVACVVCVAASNVVPVPFPVVVFDNVILVLLPLQLFLLLLTALVVGLFPDLNLPGFIF